MNRAFVACIAASSALVVSCTGGSRSNTCSLFTATVNGQSRNFREKSKAESNVVIDSCDSPCLEVYGRSATGHEHLEIHVHDPVVGSSASISFPTTYGTWISYVDSAGSQAYISGGTITLATYDHACGSTASGMFMGTAYYLSGPGTVSIANATFSCPISSCNP